MIQQAPTLFLSSLRVFLIKAAHLGNIGFRPISAVEESLVTNCKLAHCSQNLTSLIYKSKGLLASLIVTLGTV